MAIRKARGPRTPREREEDAARTAATLFEDLPPSNGADTYLRPLATFLRFLYGSASKRREEEAERAYDGLLEHVRHWRTLFPSRREGTPSGELVFELQDLLRTLEARLWDYADAPPSPELLDEGIALAVRVDRVVVNAVYGEYGRTRGLKAAQRTIESAAVHGG